MKSIGDIVKFKKYLALGQDENDETILKEYTVIEEIFAVKQIDEKIIYITKTGNEYSHDSMVEDEE